MQILPMQLKIFFKYLVNFGNKYLLISTNTEQVVDSKRDNDDLKTTDETSLIGEEAIFLDNEAPDAEESPLKIVLSMKSASNDHVIILHESKKDYYYETPDEHLLSAVGIQFKAQMKLKKATVNQYWHKIIIDYKHRYRIALVDERSLESNETPADKETTIIKLLKAKNWVNEHNYPSRVKFFPAIEKVFNDKNIGEICGGYFYTDSGTRYMSSTKGSGTDLRAEPIEGTLSFIKLDISWPQNPGSPKLWLHGSSEMLERANESLNWSKMIFSSQIGSEANFLEEILNYASW